MAPGKWIQQLKAARAQGAQAAQEKQAAKDEEDYWEGIKVDLKAAKAQIVALVEENSRLESIIAKLESTVSESKTRYASLSNKYDKRYRMWKTECQRNRRQEGRTELLSETVRQLKEVGRSQSRFIKTLSTDHKCALAVKGQLEEEKKKLSQRLSVAKELGKAVNEKHEASLALVNTKLKDAQKKVSTLKKRDSRAKGVLNRSVQSAVRETWKKATTFHLKHKGVFTEPVRHLIRYLVHQGLPGIQIYHAIRAVCGTAGIKVVGHISRTSVIRIIREGGIAAKVQVAYELKNSRSVTASSDGTGHRAINYNSRHLNLLTKDYNTGEVGHTTRFLGIMPSLDGSSEESIKDYDQMLDEICDLFNRSPFGQRHQESPLRIVDILVKLTGMHTDHCAKEKKDVEAMKKKKAEAVQQIVGKKKMVTGTEEELLPYFTKARKAMLKTLGGEDAWKALSEVEQAEKNAEMLHGIVMEIGKESLELMSEEEARILKLFIWAGCGCHKELNTVKGGCAAIKKYYDDHNSIPRPVLLPNRDNAIVLGAVATEEDVEDEIQAHALEKTEGGGIKCAQLAGAILNHKDDKKGHHDLFRYWWQYEVGFPFTFPDTSNTRFGSYCAAAIVLILHLEHFKKFMLYIKEKKGRWSNMEKNFWNALNDPPTLCELIILGFYAESIGIPYMIAIREYAKKKHNMLNLGPLHKDVYDHLLQLSRDPGQLLSGDSTSHLITVLHGGEWRNPGFITKAQSMASSLPHLRPLLTAFFRGAGATWKR